MRRIECRIEPAHKRVRGFENVVPEHAGYLFGKQALFHSVAVVKPRMCAPADKKRGIDIRFRPIHYLAQLVPVIDFVERQCFHGCAGDYQPVEPAGADIGKGLVKRAEVFLRGVFGFMCRRFQEGYIELKRGVGQKAQKLSFCDFFCRHEVEDRYLQRAYVLRKGTGFVHRENILLRKYFSCRKGTRYHYGHCMPPKIILFYIIA